MFIFEVDFLERFLRIFNLLFLDGMYVYYLGEVVYIFWVESYEIKDEYFGVILFY